MVPPINPSGLKFRKMKILIPMMSVAALLAGWAMFIYERLPSDGEVARAFSKRHPEFSDVRVTRGEGDQDELDSRIDYRERISGASGKAKWYIHSSGQFSG